jgi:lipopolysaccharide transport system ATP-binding protein
MSHTAVRVNNLGKRYRLGEVQGYRVFSDSLKRTFSRRPTAAQTADEARDRNILWALRNVSFEVGKGEVVAIIGRNGAGKSTLLKVLSRIVEPTEGSVEIHGRVGSLLEVGTGFHPELTGRENTFLNGAILGMKQSEIRCKFDEIVAFAEMDRFIDTPVKRYSSGMYTRLAFAVAAHLEPEVLIVDEVLAVGDAAFQKKCIGRMNDVAREGRTVLFVSHNMTAVKSFCEKAVWLKGGSVYRQGDVSDVTNEYLQTHLNAETMSFDLTSAERAYEAGSRLKLTRVTLNRGDIVHHGQPLHVAIEFEARAEAPDLALGLGFSSVDGVRIVSIDSDLQGERRTIRPGTKGLVEFSIDRFDLQPGTYALDIGARSGDTFGLDYLPAFAQIEVLPGPTTPPAIIRADGGVRMPAQWTWNF